MIEGALTIKLSPSLSLSPALSLASSTAAHQAAVLLQLFSHTPAATTPSAPIKKKWGEKKEKKKLSARVTRLDGGGNFKPSFLILLPEAVGDLTILAEICN